MFRFVNILCFTCSAGVQGNPLGFLKFMITQQRIPIAAVSMRIAGVWHQMERSGDNYWQPVTGFPSSVVRPSRLATAAADAGMRIQ